MAHDIIETTEKAAWDGHIINTKNPHEVTYEQVQALFNQPILNTITMTDCNTLTDGVWRMSRQASNLPQTNSAAIVFHKSWDENFKMQIAVNTTQTFYYRIMAGGTWTAWMQSYDTGHSLSFPQLELTPPTGTTNGGYIDFHYGGSAADYTSRIIEDSSGHLEITASNGVKLGTDLADVNKAALRNITCSTTDLIAGSSTLVSGRLYLVYE